MKHKKIYLLSLLSLIISAFFAFQSVFAQGVSIIPTPKQFTKANCLTNIKNNPVYLINGEGQNNNVIREKITCGIYTGDIHMWMIPYFIKYLAEFLIGLAGILCMLFIVIGGYQFTFAGMIEEKEKGKRTLIYAISGLAIVLLSWTIVNVVMWIVTY